MTILEKLNQLTKKLKAAKEQVNKLNQAIQDLQETYLDIQFELQVLKR